MAERSSSLACKKFSANVFDKNKCQNCFKPKDVHTSSPTLPERPTNLELGTNRPKTTVKSGTLSLATQISTLPKIQVQKWENVWFMLYSSGILEWFSSEPIKSSQTSLGSINMDDCLGLTSAECETNEPFSMGIKTTAKTFYLKAENRLEMDNWCRVLKPFVIASPGYSFNKTSPTSRSLSQHDSKTSAAKTNPAEGRKSSVSRTVSAPWKASTDQKSLTGSGNVARNRWSATEELLAKRETNDNNSKNNSRSSKETKNITEKQGETEKPGETRPLSDPALQPYYTDLYVKPEPSPAKQNIETNRLTSTLEQELVEAKRIAKHSQGKAEMCSKNLLDTKKQLEKANNIVSIQKANIEALTTEIDSLKTKLRKSDEMVERRLKELELPTCNGNTSRDSIESGFIKLQSKLQDNEKALIRRTRELEKANESRKKVAKHTRALLHELEGKLTENNGRITELEEQLMNKTLDLQYEKEERQRIEREKGQLVKDLNVSSQHSKQREITKRSTELLQQAKDEHKQSKNEQKTQQEIVTLSKQLEGKNSEISKLHGQLATLDKKDEELRRLEETYKTTVKELERQRAELVLVSENYDKEKTTCSELKTKIQESVLKVKENEEQTKQVQQENADLKSEIERTRKECDIQVLLLQEDNETTRTRLQEVQEELESLHTETDGNPDFEKMSRDFEELKTKSQKHENECRKLKDSQMETVRVFNNEKNKRLKLEKDFEEKCSDLKNSQKDVEKFRELLRTTEEKYEKKSEKVRELEGICKSAEQKDEYREAKYSEKLNELEAKIQNYLSEIKDAKGKLCQREEEVLRMKTELEKRGKVDRQVLNRIENLESIEAWSSFVHSNSNDQFNVGEDMRDKTSVVDAVEVLCQRLEVLSSSLKEEKDRTCSLEQSLQKQQSSARRCSACEKHRNENAILVENLEEATLNHRKELERLKESMNNESQALKSQTEEMKLKLTSKVILLQSDVSELSAKHESELAQVHEQHKNEVQSRQQRHENELNEAIEKHQQDAKSLQEQHERELKQLKDQQSKDAESRREKHEHEIQELHNQHRQELDAWRGKCDSLNTSNNEEIISLREKLAQLETQLSNERESNERRIETLKNANEARTTDVKENGVVSLTELEEAKDKHSKELEEIKEKHRLELEENKSDMMMVLQALKSDSYQSSSMSNESLEMNDELKKLERHVDALKKEHEEEIKRLNREHEEDLNQLRSDMVTLLRVQETYKTPEEGKANVGDLDEQLTALKSSHEKELREKDAQHKLEVDQLKSDMLVAIQAASTVGNISSQISPDARVSELETYVANLERDFEEERENLQNAIKKAESATKFGLRRNEEMSNKIYQMQREMEEIDSKYQKEIKLYKEAFDQEKNRKTTIGAVPGILAENESLKVKLQESELSMEQMQVRYDGEIKRYKEKFQQENVLSVEELQLKIKSLEDSIEQMRIEHESELERYTKAVKRGKVSLAGTAKERDLERKIDDLELTVNGMRQKHREEVRKYRERLEDEMERHRKEVQESRAKLRKLEADTRQLEDLKNKITDFENKTSKLSKEAGKYKEQEIELNETKTKNRELQRQVDTLKRKLEKLEEAAEGTKETGSESTLTSARAKLSRYSSLDNIGLNATNKTKPQSEGESSETTNGEEDVFEMNNNSAKSEIGGYKLNPGLKRPASVSAFPVQNENGSRRTTAYSDKRRESGSTSNRTSYQPAYLKSSTSASSLK